MNNNKAITAAFQRAGDSTKQVRIVNISHDEGELLEKLSWQADKGMPELLEIYKDYKDETLVAYKYDADCEDWTRFDVAVLVAEENPLHLNLLEDSNNDLKLKIYSNYSDLNIIASKRTLQDFSGYKNATEMYEAELNLLLQQVTLVTERLSRFKALKNMTFDYAVRRLQQNDKNAAWDEILQECEHDYTAAFEVLLAGLQQCVAGESAEPEDIEYYREFLNIVLAASH